MIEVRIQKALESFAPGSKLLGAKPLNGGISATMTAFDVELPSGKKQKFIARIPSPWKFKDNPGVASEEFRVLVALQSAGLPVPPPIFLEEATDGHPSPFFVVEFIDGHVELNPADEHAYLDRYAAQLAQIHRTDHSQLDLSFLPEQDEGYWHREELNEAMREPEIRARLAEMGEVTKSNSPVLRHGDFWPGNVLWRDDKIAGVIDWEEILVGEPLADLAICRLDLWWVFGEKASDEFTRMYQARTQIDLSDMPYWDLCASLRPMKGIEYWASSYPHLGRPEVTETTMMRDHAEFVERALQNSR